VHLVGEEGDMDWQESWGSASPIGPASQLQPQD
jgi:hypothetical protein